MSAARQQIEAMREDSRRVFLGTDLGADPLTRAMASAAYHAFGRALAALDAPIIPPSPQDALPLPGCGSATCAVATPPPQEARTQGCACDWSTLRAALRRERARAERAEAAGVSVELPRGLHVTEASLLAWTQLVVHCAGRGLSPAETVAKAQAALDRAGAR